MFPGIIKLSIITLMFFGIYHYSDASFTISRPSTLNSGLVGYWTFDGADVTDKVYDKSGQGNHGYFYGGATTTAKVKGKIGQALKFDGVDDRVNAGNISAWDLAGTDHSFSLWFKASIDNTGSDFLLDRFSGGTPGAGYLISLGTNGRLSLDERADGGDSIAKNDTSKNYRDNAWHHVIGIVNTSSKTGTLYVDGVNKGSDSYTGNLINQNESLTLGSDSSDSTYIYSGLIDEVRIYNRALSASEVKSLYNQSASKFNKTPTNTLTNGLVGHWTFDGADTNWTTNTVVDRSGNGNTGTMTNMSTSTSPAKGKIGQALKFDGVNDYVNVGDPANGSLDFGTNSFSYGMWVYVDNNRGSYDMPWNKGGSNAGDPGYDFEFGSSTWTINIADGISVKSSSSFGNGVLKQWVYVMAVVDRGNNRLHAYKNGVLVSGAGVDLTGFGSVSGSTSANIGRRYDGSYPFNGLIDEVRIYNRALSASEVKALYNMGR